MVPDSIVLVDICDITLQKNVKIGPSFAIADYCMDCRTVNSQPPCQHINLKEESLCSLCIIEPEIYTNFNLINNRFLHVFACRNSLDLCRP